MTITDHAFVDLDTPSGPMRTFVFRPTAPGRYPGILLFSEIFQVTGPIRRTAALLAGHGFVVAAPEIYHEYEPAGAALAYDSAGADRGNALKTTKPLDAYDAEGQFLSGTLADYLLPTATDFPNLRCVVLDNYPSPINPLGAKGAGEGGIIAAGGCMANAVANALSSLGVQPLQLPLSPTYIWELVQAGQKQAAE